MHGLGRLEHAGRDTFFQFFQWTRRSLRFRDFEGCPGNGCLPDKQVGIGIPTHKAILTRTCCEVKVIVLNRLDPQGKG